ncbi:hypothetical protein [Peptoniphilus gorbachii]|uniref:hypothetical protein n=1 Tax=Peptoniphilus gorbachii TaxID=411567 RepID=UPI0012EA64E0
MKKKRKINNLILAYEIKLIGFFKIIINLKISKKIKYYKMLIKNKKYLITNVDRI